MDRETDAILADFPQCFSLMAVTTPATPTTETAQRAFTSRACKQLRRPPLCSGPPCDTPGPLQHNW